MTTLIRLPQVLEIYPKSRSALYADMAEGKFPQSVSIGARAVAWNLDEVLAKVDELIAEAADQGLVKLSQAAKEMGIPPEDLETFVESGDLPAVTIGKNIMIRQAEIDAFQKEHAATIQGLAATKQGLR